MYLISKEQDLTQQRLGKIIQQFTTRDLPKLKRYWNYYIGKHDILMKKYSDETKPCAKVIINYPYSIVNTYGGYICGRPIKYNNDNFDDVLDILNYNDYVDEDQELLRLALIYGVSYEINYVDEDSKQRFRVLDPKECIPIYYNNLNNDLAYVVRFYREDLLDEDNENWIVEVYGNESTKIYKSVPGFTSFSLIEEVPNFFNQVPITVFQLNKDEEPIFKQVMSLVDSYEELFSGSVDDFSQFADAYLVLKGAVADSDDLAQMKKNRVIMLDPDSDASYLTKSIQDTALQNTLEIANEHIHTISNAPDFYADKFMTNTGIALRYKLVGFENMASKIESSMRKALQKRIELICSVLSMVNGEDRWRDCEIVFTRNLPLTLEPNNPTELMAYQNLISDRTLLEQIPFVKNVDEELEQVKQEREESMEVYSMGMDNELLEQQGASQEG